MHRLHPTTSKPKFNKILQFNNILPLALFFAYQMRNLGPSGFALWFVSCITVVLLDLSHLPTFFCHFHVLLHPISPWFPWLFRSVSLHWSFSGPCPVISRPISFTSAFIRLLHRSSFIHAEKLRFEALRAHPTSNSSTSQPHPGFCDGSPSPTLKSWGGRKPCFIFFGGGWLRLALLSLNLNKTTDLISPSIHEYLLNYFSTHPRLLWIELKIVCWHGGDKPGIGD